MAGFVRFASEFKDEVDPVSGQVFPGILNADPTSSSKFQTFIGSGYFIGDGLVLTAGDNIFCKNMFYARM